MNPRFITVYAYQETTNVLDEIDVLCINLDQITILKSCHLYVSNSFKGNAGVTFSGFKLKLSCGTEFLVEQVELEDIIDPN